jgi:exonuclease SbcC
MIVDRLRLTNFRSYTQEEVVFSPGVSLFEGDIGSGKSSLLFAVEFALFGPADVPGDHLLRAGADEGSIELTFRAGGQTYTVGRRMRRDKKGNLQQKDAYLERGGVREDLSTTQLREAVIQVLGFREVPNPRTKSQVFRYGVFTPQEEMKAILEQDAEERKQTLRRAFGIEEFKRARENAGLLSRALNDLCLRCETRLEGAPRLESEREEAQAALAASQGAVVASGKARAAAEAEAQAAWAALEAVESLEKADREAERAESAKRGERAAASERHAFARRQVDEMANVEALAPPLRELAATVAQREEHLKEYERLEREHREREEAARAAKARLDSVGEQVADLERQAANNELVLARAEEVEAGQKALAAARKALHKAVEAHTSAREAQRQVKAAQARLEKAEHLIASGARASQESKALAPTIEAGAQARAALPDLEGKRGTAQASAGAARMELERLERELEEFSSLTGKARCPKCKQEISRDHLQGHREELEAALAGAKRNLARAQGEGRALDREWSRLVQVRDAGAEAQRVQAALDKEASLALEASKEASELQRQIEEARALAGQGEQAAAERERLEREVEQKAHYDQGAGQIEAARKHEADLQKRLKKARQEMAAATATEQEVRLELAGRPFDASKGEAARRAVREARDAAVRLKQVEESLSGKARAEAFAAQAAQALGAVERDLEALSQARAQAAKRLAQADPATVRQRHASAIAARSAAAEQEKAAAQRLEEAGARALRAARDLEGLAAERTKLDTLRHARDFVEQCFAPGMEAVEQQVLADLNLQFNARFQEYFARLMEGAPVDVQIGQDFTPEVTQGEQPLPVQALSGGERTSIALAYRLALNILVSRAAGMETPDLLVLDEPTDGFSKEQLARVGELIRDLDCQQVILVSHERELETCADHVFEVVKDGTVSRVVAR